MMLLQFDIACDFLHFGIYAANVAWHTIEWMPSRTQNNRHFVRIIHWLIVIRITNGHYCVVDIHRWFFSGQYERYINLHML